MATMKKNLKKEPERLPTDPGTLYIIATPIGNLEDITLRALRILKEVDLIAAEDTRHTRKLLTHYKIQTPTFSYYKEKEQSRSEKIIEKLLAGQDVGLVSDAGTPGISDPGSILVQKAVSENIRVEPIPGASSLSAALSVSGIADNSFVFLGFAPSRKKQRQDLLQSLVREKKHLVFFEAPHRLEKFLHDCLDILGNRHIIWGREITKIHEEFIRDTVTNLLDSIKNKNIKGESVLIIAGAPDEPPLSDINIESLLTAYKKSGKFSLKDAVKKTATENKVSRSTVYSIALKVWDKP
jgi:16S rRNA (cytidine1402-2'-O)-methyltransferase